MAGQMYHGWDMGALRKLEHLGPSFVNNAPQRVSGTIEVEETIRVGSRPKNSRIDNLPEDLRKLAEDAIDEKFNLTVKRKKRKWIDNATPEQQKDPTFEVDFVPVDNPAVPLKPISEYDSHFSHTLRPAAELVVDFAAVDSVGHFSNNTLLMRQRMVFRHPEGSSPVEEIHRHINKLETYWGCRVEYHIVDKRLV